MSEYLKGLNQVHLSRLSPVMWSVKHGYPRKAMTVPIESVGGMSGDDDGRYKSVPLDYQRQPVWNDLYRVGVLGAMSRVAPFGPAGFGTEPVTGDSTKKWLFFLGAIGIGAFLFSRFA